MMFKIDRTAWLFSLNCFVAGVMALGIGYWLDLPRPNWALMTVYIISQPLAGAVRSKAIFRVCGTLLGAAFAVLVVPVLIDTPVLLSVALATWMSGCLFISLLDRTPRAYVVMLSGYTACLIAFPTVNHPEQIFDIAVARVEEILLGIACATATHSLFFPRPVGSVLQQRLAAWLADGDSWALALLRGGDPLGLAKARRHLASAATEIHLIAVLLPFDTSALRDASAVVRALHQRLTLLVPLLSAIGDRITALGDEVAPIRPELLALANWIEGGMPPAATAELSAQLTDARALQIGADWPSLLRESLLSRLHDLLDDLSQSHRLLDHLRHPEAVLPTDLAAALASRSNISLRPDTGLALVSGLAALISILLVCALWIITGWPEGSVAAALAGVFCALFAALDDPAPAIVTFGVASAAALPVAALYQFAIFPAIDGFPLLAMVLAPPLLLVGGLMVNRRTAAPALFFIIGLASSLALQENYSSDFAGFINSNTALYVGLLVSIIVTRAMRSMSVDVALARLQTRNWASLATLAKRDTTTDIATIALHQMDRLGLVLPKLAATGGADDQSAVTAVTELRIAMNIALLQHNRLLLQPTQANALTRLLHQTGAYFAGRIGRNLTPPGPELLASIDGNLRQLSANTAPDQRKGVTALVGLRRNLFPNAAPFQPQTQAEEAR